MRLTTSMDTSQPNEPLYDSNREHYVIGNPDENQIMRYKLLLYKKYSKLPIMELPSSNLTFNGFISQTITPNTRNEVINSRIYIRTTQRFLIYVHQGWSNSPGWFSCVLLRRKTK